MVATLSDSTQEESDEYDQQDGHTMDHQYFEDNLGDLVGLAQLLGHESLNTTARYVKKTEGQLADATDKLNY